ncbi:Oidioi.mRNA.OKI2018_I69.XSR.g15251.t1.cds [Oikopleura dioica]|uniref:Oidioi.mRNA.OKI2018_I69.XSR.g15251.t1.cds n=1 Tax=Oikopleura dioica TaxID=34765 RepID=A0ABN7SGE6_OIKDI|nr:Oidioi.mRNA.OKI2018_I69.XSR.g15251.t1.cds [Oikopleura dioica]
MTFLCLETRQVSQRQIWRPKKKESKINSRLTLLHTVSRQSSNTKNNFKKNRWKEKTMKTMAKSIQSPQDFLRYHSTRPISSAGNGPT